MSSHYMICILIISPSLQTATATHHSLPFHMHTTGHAWYPASADFPSSAYRDDAVRLQTDNSFYPTDQSSSARFFVPVTQDSAHVQPYDTCDRSRHYDALPYTSSTSSTCVSAGYPPTPSFYYSEYYHSTRRPDNTPAFEMGSYASNTDKFSFDDFEILHAGDILALESPLPPHSGKDQQRLTNESSDGQADVNVSCESVCTHSDSSCDEYIVTSLDDSTTSSGVNGVSFPAQNWTSPDVVYGALCAPPHYALGDVQTAACETMKYETGQ